MDLLIPLTPRREVDVDYETGNQIERAQENVGSVITLCAKTTKL